MFVGSAVARVSKNSLEKIGQIISKMVPIKVKINISKNIHQKGLATLKKNIRTSLFVAFSIGFFDTLLYHIQKAVLDEI